MTYPPMEEDIFQYTRWFSKLSKFFWIKLYNGIVKTYVHVKRDYLKFLPSHPLDKIGMEKPISKFLTKTASKDFEPLIQEELLFYVKNHDKLEDLQGSWDIGNLLKFIRETENLPGDIIELGTYKGGTTIMLARFLKKISSKRRIFTCDAFIGLPADDKFSYTKDAKGKMSDTNSKLVLKKFQKFGVEDKITLIDGLFEKTLYEKLGEQKFSLVFMDCDLYESAKFCLEFIFPRLDEGGITMFDEYDQNFRDNPKWGETRAVDEFCLSNKIKINLFPVPHIKKTTGRNDVKNLDSTNYK